jgi:molybdopterin adenylyltransferase
MRVAVLTISDACAAGARQDASGEVIVAWVGSLPGGSLAARAVVPDESVEIVRVLLAWCDGDVADLVLTTGGTGLSPRDITPEATRAVLDREAPGLGERIRGLSMGAFPRAALARGLAGVRGRTLVVNLPGSPGGVRDALAALDPVVAHAVQITRGVATDHSNAIPPS